MTKSEDSLVRWLAARSGLRRGGVAIGIGDDMAMIEVGGQIKSMAGRGGRGTAGRLLATVDMLMDGVDFDASIHSPRLIGRKAIAASLSDCAAMAVRPRYALVSVALPEAWSMRQAKELYRGVQSLAAKYGCTIIGGDTNSWRHPLAIDVIVLAEPWPDCQPVRRRGMKPGDAVCVTGALGGSLYSSSTASLLPPLPFRERAGVRVVTPNSMPRATISADRLRTHGGAAVSAVEHTGETPVPQSRHSPTPLPHHLTFEPRVREAHSLAAGLGRHLHAMMDLSDGLSTDAARMAAASGCGVEFDSAALISAASEAAQSASLQDGRTLLDHVLNDGEDFELLFAVDATGLSILKAPAQSMAAQSRGRAASRLADAKLPQHWTKVGAAVAGKGLWLRTIEGRRERMKPGGWQHFKNS